MRIYATTSSSWYEGCETEGYWYPFGNLGLRLNLRLVLNVDSSSED